MAQRARSARSRIAVVPVGGDVDRLADRGLVASRGTLRMPPNVTTDERVVDRAVERATDPCGRCGSPGTRRAALDERVVAVHVLSVAQRPGLTTQRRIRSVLGSVVDLQQVEPAAARGGEPRRRADPRARGRRLGQDPRDHVPDRAPARAGHPAAGDLRADVHQQGRRGDARARRAPARTTRRLAQRADDRHVPRARPADPARRSARRSGCRAASRSTTSPIRSGAVREVLRTSRTSAATASAGSTSRRS